MAARRSYGAGSLTVRTDARGREVWIGRVRVGGRQVKRALGPKRATGSREGLTRTQAEQALRRVIDDVAAAPPAHERVTLAEAGERYLLHLGGVMERKRSTVQDYSIMLTRHLAPFFAGRSLDSIDTDLVAAYRRAKASDGLAPKTVQNHLAFLHGVFAHAVKRGWARANPVATLDRPPTRGADPDIRFLDDGELEALVRAVPDDALGGVERVLYLAAAMTGLRRGELLALRWQDVDWTAGLVRVRRSYTRGEWGSPKSRRSTRAVPMADRVGADLERLYQRSTFQDDGDLVFAHPVLGSVLDPSKLRKRFLVAVGAAGVRPVRFHDLRHTFGTRMAAAGAPLRAIQEWMGHRDYKTTSIYADYAPDPTQGATWAARAFGDASRGLNHGLKLSGTERTESTEYRSAMPDSVG